MIFKTNMKRTLHLNDGFYWFIHFQKEFYKKYTKMDLRNEKRRSYFAPYIKCFNFPQIYQKNSIAILNIIFLFFVIKSLKTNVSKILDAKLKQNIFFE